MNRHPSDPENWSSPALTDLYSLLQKRAAMADSDTPGKRACAEFAQELFSGKAGLGMSRTDRNSNSRDAVSNEKQAMETSQRIPSSQIASIAASPAARQLLSLSQQQEKFPAAVALPDSVRGKADADKNSGLKKEEK
jgi:hypothetical protein